MSALLAGGDLVHLTGGEARQALADIRAALLADRLVPYLGPGLIAAGGPATVPLLPEEIARELNRRTPAPSRIRTNMWAVAQYIDSRKHRKTLSAYMRDIFRDGARPSDFHRFLAGLPLSLVVDTWYDGAMRAAYADSGRTDVADVRGTTRAGINLADWHVANDLAGGAMTAEAVAGAATLLYSPHGRALPAGDVLVADSDYVEVLTEIDIQTPIPEPVRERRMARGFLFLGCRFHDQMLRTYARQIKKRSAGPHWAVGEAAGLVRNELRFLAAEGITLIDLPLAEATEIIAG